MPRQLVVIYRSGPHVRRGSGIVAELPPQRHWNVSCYGQATVLAKAIPAAIPYVTVIGDHARTIEGLRQYLNAAGVYSVVMRQLPDRTTDLALGIAVIIFPDDFETQEVLATIEALQQRNPRLWLLVVTSFPRNFQVTRLMDRARPPIIMPKPAFGWSILDELRAISSTEGESW